MLCIRAKPKDETSKFLSKEKFHFPARTTYYLRKKAMKIIKLHHKTISIALAFAPAEMGSTSSSLLSRDHLSTP